MVRLFNACMLLGSLAFTSQAMFQVTACEATNNFALQADSFGNLITVWTEKEKDISLVKFSIKTINEDWSSAIILSNPNQNSISPIIAARENGDIIAVWLALNSETQKNSLVVSILPYKGSWSEPVVISALDELIISNTYRIKVSNTDEIAVFWNSVFIKEEQAVSTLRCATARVGERWSSPTSLS